MNEQKDIDKRVAYKACTYALAELMRKGSFGFATVIDGEWVRRDYSLILETLYNIFEKEENQS